MTAVRELVARLGFQVDKSGFQQAEKAIGNVRESLKRAGGEARRAGAKLGMAGGESGKHYRDAAGRMRDAQTGRYVGKGKRKEGGAGGEGGMLKTLGKMAATAGIEHVLESIVELGSRAEETANVLGAVFGKERAAEISQWAETTATEVGRSKYALAEMAGQLGAVATPMLGNQQRAMEMSEAFAKLAVDMGSFYNSTDEDALAALRSAMTGEVESIKRYGVVMNDATMQEYARTQGIHKKISAMTIAEKTELRFGYIMKTTAAAQGDAARTSNGYANSIKAVKAMMMDFGTDMGRAVLPMIEQLLVNVRDGIRWFKQMTDNTHVLQAAMGVLAAIAGVLAVDLLLPWVPAMLAIGATILLVDELWSMFTGGESVIGDFIDTMFGIGTTEDVVNSLRAAWQWLNETFTELKATMPDLIGMWDLLTGSAEDWGAALEEDIEWLADLVDAILNLPLKIGKAAAAFLGFKVEQDDAVGRATGRGVDAGVMTREEAKAARAKDRDALVRGGVDRRNALRVARNAERARKRRVSDIESEIDKSYEGLDDKTLGKADRQALNDKIATLEKERAGLMGANPDAALQSVNDQVDAAGNASQDPDAIAAAAARPVFGRARLRDTQRAPAGPQAYESWTLGMSVDPTVSAPLASTSSQPVQQNVTNQTTFNITGNNPNEIAKVVDKKLDERQRRAAAALPRPAGA